MPLKKPTVLAIGAVLLFSGPAQAKSVWRKVQTPFQGQINGVAISPRGFLTGLQRWFIQADSIADGLNDIVALDTLTAWAVGGLNVKPVVFHTSDGGLHWERQSATSLSNWIATGVSFPDRRHGWVVGASEFYYLRTSDGGQTWQELDLPARFSPTTVEFVDSLRGWIVGISDTVLRTTNGGETWEKHIVGNFRGKLLDLKFISRTNGWVVGGDASPNSSPLILSTTDGGITWQRFPALYSAYIAVDLLDSLHAWFSGGLGGLTFTNDGGTTWNDVNLPGAGNNYYPGISFVDSLNGWAVGGGGFGRGEILRTTDGGFTWSFELEDTLFPFDRIAMVDATHGWVVGANGFILKYAPPLILGDLNVDGEITAADVVLELNRTFLGQPFPAPPEMGDVNCDNAFTAADVILLLNRAFLGIPFPCNK